MIDATHIHFIGTHVDDSAEAERIAVRSAWEWLSQDHALSEAVRFSICASLLDVNHGGPAGANVVAAFCLDELTLAGFTETIWPLA